jgi:hypothetical protein
MKYNIFISYPNSQVDIVQNFKQQIEGYGVTAWVYATDRTLAKDLWSEIEQKINESDLVLFVVSTETSTATGQQRELMLAAESKIMPIFTRGIEPKDVPEQLSKINGEFLEAHNVKEVALKIAKQQFPDLFDRQSTESWRYPLPGEWLEVINLNANIGQYFDLGDRLYFRAISPIGLFECYAPKIQDCFWIAPENVKPSYDKEKNKELERDIPFIYTVMGMIRIDQLGWDAWREIQNKNENRD